MAQVQSFTEAELRQVFRLFLSETEADSAARDAVAPRAAQEGVRTPTRTATPYRPVSHASLTDDTLIMLSLLSDSLRAKVDQLLETRGQSLDRDFRQRRDELRPWVEEQLRRPR